MTPHDPSAQHDPSTRQWDGRPPADTVAIIGSEFAQIAVGLDGTGNSTRLRLQDLRTGRIRQLDALELETIVWLGEQHLAALLDPSADRWREDR